MSDYSDFSDDELIGMIRGGDRAAEEFLMTRYISMVGSEVRFLFLVGAEDSDLFQEGMIGLFKAIRDYKEESSASFHTFATTCVRNQIHTAITAANRKKHIPLNSSVSLNSLAETEDSTIELQNIIPDSSVMNPEDLYLMKEDFDIKQALLESELSSLEKEVAASFLDGMSRSEIAKRIGKDEKAVSNTLNRIKSKLKEKIG